MGQDARLQVDAIKPPESKGALYKSVWQSCQEANIPVPSEVDEFFEGEAHDGDGKTRRFDVNPGPEPVTLQIANAAASDGSVSWPRGDSPSDA